MSAMYYPPIVLYFYVREQRRVAQVRLPARADVVPVVGLVPTASPSSRRLEGMLQTSREHNN
jgi:hypothetical protein